MIGVLKPTSTEMSAQRMELKPVNLPGITNFVIRKIMTKLMQPEAKAVAVRVTKLLLYPVLLVVHPMFPERLRSKAATSSLNLLQQTTMVLLLVMQVAQKSRL